LIERDIFPVDCENLKVVPQGKHVHALLDLGRRIIEKFLPGLFGRINNGDVIS
jgi:hypothetical protein